MEFCHYMRFSLFYVALAGGTLLGTAEVPWVADAERQFVRGGPKRIEFQPGDPEPDAVRFYSKDTDYVSFNYDESKAGVLGIDYTLEDPLRFASGKKVETIKDWILRRREILAIYESEVYGRMPPRPETVEIECCSERLQKGGFSIEKRYRMWFRKDKTGPVIDWIAVLPNNAAKPCPVILHLNYAGNDCIARGKTNHFDLPLKEFASRGYAFISAFYQQITSDDISGNADNIYDGVCELWGRRDPAAMDNPGALIIWAWGLCRGLDLASKMPDVDEKRNVVVGSSRLGKAALIAAAFDERFAVCVPNQTGKIGVELLKRNYGASLKGQRLSAPHWYCRAVWKYAENPRQQPFDQHLLLSCVAPRALLLECYHKKWFDPKGEFLAAQAAAPVWKFLSGKTLEAVERPNPFEDTFVSPPFGYVTRNGTHGLSLDDWHWILDFADRSFKK